jgi:hypothetical protein
MSSQSLFAKIYINILLDISGFQLKKNGSKKKANPKKCLRETKERMFLGVSMEKRNLGQG